ncbi:hypothetical protein AB0M28_00750 [Streptomyces sp. NPDC051940]|uniref:hypothetical protein n=1 Tax=Streptomyces sp. NPDC051940 TaxID=3155675 RepID=UPI003416A6F2
MAGIRPDRRGAHPRSAAVRRAAAVCVLLGGMLLAGCSASDSPGYAAVGAGTPPETGVGGAVRPTDPVRMVPLETPAARSPEARESGEDDAGEGPGGGEPSAPEASGTPAPSASAATAPAELTWTAPKLADTEERWCEQVTMTFTNSGGAPVIEGTVTFGTHIIGALGVDWATVESAHALPAPIAGGATVSKTWTVCVDSWRVPLGMRVETRDADVVWKG